MRTAKGERMTGLSEKEFQEAILRQGKARSELLARETAKSKEPGSDSFKVVATTERTTGLSEKEFQAPQSGFQVWLKYNKLVQLERCRCTLERKQNPSPAERVSSQAQI